MKINVAGKVVVTILCFTNISISCLFASKQSDEIDKLLRIKPLVRGDDIIVYQKIVQEKEDEIMKGMLSFFYKDALLAYKENRFDDALIIGREMLLLDPGNKEISIFKEGLKEIIKYGGTRKAKKRVIELYYQRGLDFYTQGDLVNAVEIWQKALVLSPGYKDCKNLIKRARKHLTEVYYQEGLNFYKTRKYALALGKWYIVAKIDPNYGNVLALIKIAKEEVFKQKIDGLYKRGIALRKAGKLEKALEVFKKLLALSPRHKSGLAGKKEIRKSLTAYYFNKGEKYFKGKNFKKAIRFFKNALRFSPGSTRILGYLSKAREEQALLALKPKPKRKSQVKEVILSSEKKSTDLAKIKKREITQTDIEEAEKHYITGLYYYQNGFLEEAVAEWETVLRINPRHDKTKTSLKKVKGELRKLRY